jgi:hypothetical protein
MHGVVEVIRAIHGIVGSDRDSMRPIEQPFTPGKQQASFWIKHRNRVIAAIEDENPVLRVNSDG